MSLHSQAFVYLDGYVYKKKIFHPSPHLGPKMLASNFRLVKFLQVVVKG